MIGDLYHVRYQKFETGTGVHTDPNGPWDTWGAAKAIRNSTYFDFGTVISATWVERSNPSLGLKTERYGAVLKRKKPQK